MAFEGNISNLLVGTIENMVARVMLLNAELQ